MIHDSEESDPDDRSASIDIHIDPAHHRHGYVSDAITTLVGHPFDERGHHRITIDPTADNNAAIACYGFVGFRDLPATRRALAAGEVGPLPSRRGTESRRRCSSGSASRSRGRPLAVSCASAPIERPGGDAGHGCVPNSIAATFEMVS